MERKTKAQIDAISHDVLDAAFAVHKELGPGLLEGIYHNCLIREFELRKISFMTSVDIPMVYKGVEMNKKYQLDLIVENEIIIELKSVAELHPVHHAQLLTYLKLTGKRLGLLINFNVPLLRTGIKRIANQL